MEEFVSLTAFKALVEKKTKKKILIKIIWNEQEKMTLFITPNMKINSFIYDDKEGYLFYDIEGKPVTVDIPSILTEKNLVNGTIPMDNIKAGKVTINSQALSNDDIQFLCH